MPVLEDVRRTKSLRATFAALSLVCGAALVVGVVASGCGGKTDDQAAPAGDDTGLADTGLADVKADGPVIVDSSKDTGTSSDDSATGFDVPGSLFDAEIPDVVFDGGLTAKGCYDCLTSKCHDQVAACDSDPRCRGVVLCVLVTCKANAADTTCLFGCATSYGITSPSDPAVGVALGVVSCQQKNCKDSCPAPPIGDGGPSTDAKSDGSSTDSASADAPGSGETGSGETGSGDATPASAHGRASEPPMSFDPALLEELQSIASEYEGNEPGARVLVDRFSHE